MPNLRLPVTAIWLLLMVATGLSWWLSREGGADPAVSARQATAGILLVAAIKVRFVILDFMDVRAAPLPLRLALEAWVLLVIVALLGLFWTSAT